MQWPETVVLVTAWVAIVLIGSAVFYGLLGLIQTRRESNAKLAWSEGRAHVLRCLYSDAKWFSEDPVTMRLLERLAKDGSVYEIREEWRASRKGAE